MKKKINKQVRVSIFWRNNYVEYESNSDGNKALSPEEYLNKIRPYLIGIINKSNTLAIVNNFISSLANDEEQVMHLKSDNIEIMINDEPDEFIKTLFDSFKNRY